MSRNLIPGLIKEFWGWLNVAEYEAAKERATDLVISRFGRRNVSVQNGYVLDDAGAKALSDDGDAAVARLRKLATTHKH